MRELRNGRPPLCGTGVATLLVGLAAVGCARAVPTAPDSVARVESPTSSELSEKSVVGFDLINGSFRLTVGSDHLAGTYTGRAQVSGSGKVETASLDLQVVSGSGAFEGASGTLRGDGKGAFSGEGSFSLSLDGILRTAVKRGSYPFHAATAGTSQSSCVEGRIILSLQGTGSAVQFGTVGEELSHEVGSTGCSS